MGEVDGWMCVIGWMFVCMPPPSSSSSKHWWLGEVGGSISCIAAAACLTTHNTPPPHQSPQPPHRVVNPRAVKDLVFASGMFQPHDQHDAQVI